MTKFAEALNAEAKLTTTTNGAVALNTTDSHVLDLFAQGGAMREWDKSSIISTFVKAFAEDALLTMKCLFYIRNIRGGLGERRTFRTGLRYLATVHPEVIRKNIACIPLFGRWDDMYTLIGTKVEKEMWDFVRANWTADLAALEEGKSISLMAKWLASADASSKETIRNAKATAKALGLSQKQYRQTLSKLRKKLNLVERHLCEGTVSEINYSAVPSRAAAIYRNAFMRKDGARYSEFINKVKAGEATINASTLYPYDILEKMCKGRGFSTYTIVYDEVLEQLWKSLPDYVDIEKTKDVLIMADTSGSMTGRPMATSIGLAVYFAERNKGVFRNQFMTFSSRPKLVTISGDTLYEKLKCIEEIIENTNLEAALQLVLDIAIDYKLDQSEMPKSIVIITDMQFDAASTNAHRHNTLYKEMARRYAAAGYTIPNIVFWNVNSPKMTFQANSKFRGVQMVSGQTPAAFQTVLNCIGKTPYEAMLETLNDPMYDCVQI